MKTRARLLVMAGAAAVGLALAACGGGSAASPDASPDQVEWLMAVSGDLTVEDRSGEQYLRLDDPSDALLFADRPARVRLDVEPETLVALWTPMGFVSDPPNAAVSVASGSPVFTTLADPAWTESGSVRWRIAGGDVPDDGPAAILIDNGTVNSQITDSVTQANVEVLGKAPAEAMATQFANLGQSAAQAMADAQQNPAGLQSGTAQGVDGVAELDPQGGEPGPAQDINVVGQQILQILDGQGVPGSSTPTD